jgi:hypothetical protein
VESIRPAESIAPAHEKVIPKPGKSARPIQENATTRSGRTGKPGFLEAHPYLIIEKDCPDTTNVALWSRCHHENGTSGNEDQASVPLVGCEIRFDAASTLLIFLS